MESSSLDLCGVTMVHFHYPWEKLVPCDHQMIIKCLNTYENSHYIAHALCMLCSSLNSNKKIDLHSQTLKCRDFQAKCLLCSMPAFSPSQRSQPTFTAHPPTPELQPHTSAPALSPHSSALSPNVHSPPPNPRTADPDLSPSRPSALTTQP